jgi:hypothetical protein
VALALWLGGTASALGHGPAHAFNLPRESPVPGGIKLVRLEDRGPVPPDVAVDGHRALVILDGTDWVAVIGIPLSAPLGLERIVEHGAQGRVELTFDVIDKQYASQSLKVAPGQVNLSKTDLARVARERLRIERAITTYTEQQPESLQLPQPVPGARSSSFGTRRIVNGEARIPIPGWTSRRRPAHRCGCPSPAQWSTPARIFSTATPCSSITGAAW